MTDPSLDVIFIDNNLKNCFRNALEMNGNCLSIALTMCDQLTVRSLILRNRFL